MADINMNNVGPVEHGNFKDVVPFDKSEYYHQKTTCKWTDAKSVEACWVNGLPDLNHNNKKVQSTLKNWF